MSDGGKGSITQIIHEAAYELAKKEMNLEDSDKKNQKMLTLLQIKINQNEEEVSQKIDSIKKQIEISFGGAILPKEIDMEVAENVLNQITINGLSSPSEISVGEEIAKECLIEALQSSDKKLEDIDKKEFYDISILEQAENMNQALNIDITQNVIVLANGLELFIEEPADKIYEFASEQDKEEEFIIEIQKSNIKMLYDSANKNPKDRKQYLKKFTEIIKNTDAGLGIDASLRFLDDMTATVGIDNEFLNDVLFTTIECLTDGTAEKVGFRDDNYTMLRKLNIISNILNKEGLDINSPQMKKTREALKKLDPEIYDLVEKNPNIVEQLKEKFGKEDMQDVAIEMAGSSEALDRQETLKKIEALRLEKSEVEEKVDSEQEITSENNNLEENVEEVEINERKNKINMTTIPSNTDKYRKGVKHLLNKIETAIPTAIKMLSSNATEDKKDVFQEVIIEKLLDEKDNPKINLPEAVEQKKNLFEILINRNINRNKKVDFQLVENLVSIDSEAVKGVLKESLIPARNEAISQNDKTTQILGQYVQAISDEMKNTSPKVLDSKKTSLSKIVGTTNVLVENKRTQQGEDEGPEL